MLSAFNKKNEKIVALNADKSDEYTCPICGENLFLKQGIIKIPHFAHYPHSQCLWNSWERESERHKEMKTVVMKNVLKWNKCTVAEYEKPIGEYIADLYFEIPRNGDKLKIAVECQCSNKTLKDFLNKTKRYTELGIHTLWLFDFKKQWHKQTHTTPEIRFPKIITETHKWNFGRFYTLHDHELYGIHLNPVYREYEYFDQAEYFYEKESYGYADYDEYFTTYKKKLKDTKTPHPQSINQWNFIPIRNNGLKFKDEYYLAARFNDKKWW